MNENNWKINSFVFQIQTEVTMGCIFSGFKRNQNEEIKVEHPKSSQCTLFTESNRPKLETTREKSILQIVRNRPIHSERSSKAGTGEALIPGQVDSQSPRISKRSARHGSVGVVNLEKNDEAHPPPSPGKGV